MNITTRKSNDITVLDIGGPFKVGPAIELFHEQVRALQADTPTQLLVNLGGISYMDSSGLGVLVRTYNKITSAGGKCKFCAAPKHVMNILKVVHLDSVLELFDDETSALSSF